MDKVWLIASGKGGTGKSSLAVNWGTLMAVGGRRVLLVDLNIGLRCLDLCLGMDDRVLFDVLDVLDGFCRPSDAVLAHPSIDSLFLMPAAQNRSPAELDGARLQTLCSKLSSEYDLIVFDCPPGLEPIPVQAARAAGRGMIVTTPDPASVRDADRMAAELSSAGLTELYLVVNRFRPDFLQNKQIVNAHEIAETIGLPLLGCIPEDISLASATLCAEPVVIKEPQSLSAKAFKAMVRGLPGKEPF